MDIFESMESEVRVYSRSFPILFNRAKNAHLFTENGDAYLDFLAGAGSLNYGHNNELFKAALLEYIQEDGVSQGLDLYTRAKADFISSYKRLILEPRGLDYKIQFTGPTGTNAVEAALKLARKVKDRSNIISFTNGFHGVSLGSAATTGNKTIRRGAGVSLNDVNFMPYCDYLGEDVNTIDLMDKMLSDPSSGIECPAAVIVEAVQGEGGLNVASAAWLKGLERLCRNHDMLLIIDDIQAGNGRTGDFFSFEEAGVYPDLIAVSKSLSGFGLPMAVVLMRPELDMWSPGEHSGTFRGNNLAFVTARAAIEHYWKDGQFLEEIRKKSYILRQRLTAICEQYPSGEFRFKGRGMMCGISCKTGEMANQISKCAFNKGLMIETSGANGEVVKCLMPLTIDEKDLLTGLELLSSSVGQVFQQQTKRAS
ncbi:diaminobutyrate--2-oxoglutarate transaminase [Marinobacter sp. EVN1]|uniref:diaminobutyrate--2-oxoglutarate transaminase n=1 Tax=Marinobacter sp. EVN1 TaxID=1397532 RepID=UPI0004CF8B1C|nr:diaminobutyrate--2-oxoglutarate transaminase [Marinobacter sp. EVN1]